MNALVCHEGFDNDARHGLGGMLAPESDLRGALQPLMREVVALGCDEEIEEEPYFVEDWEDGGAMAMQQRLLRPSPHGQRQQQRAAPMAMAEVRAVWVV